MIKFLTLITTLVFCTSPLKAKTNTEFKYKGEIIHPLCVHHFMSIDQIKTKRIDKKFKTLGTFYFASDEQNIIEMSKCQDVKKKFKSDKDGAQIYTSELNNREMYEYKVLVNFTDNTFLVSTQWNSGGTGYFSNLVVLKIEKEKLKLVSIGEVGGDRCNGGISIQDSNNNSFTVSKNLTPVDLINVTQMGKKLKIEPYEDLESSAMSCVGTKKTQYFVKNSKINFKLLGYDLSEEPNDDPDWVKRYKYQECFNKELKKMKGHLANQLATQKALENFVSQFSSSCIKK